MGVLSAPHPCHLCGTGRLDMVGGFERFRRVTSDAKPCPPGGRLAVCGECGGVQKILDDAWRHEVDRIYAAYTVYYQAGGAEQAVFDPGSDRARPRSASIVARLASPARLPDRGRLLDVGCGNGAFLDAFLRVFPSWRGLGVELDDRNRARIESIPGVDGLFVGPIAQAPGVHDLVSMIHVLEHVPRPAAFLADIRAKFADGGRFFAETPHFEENPFDLVIADHASHFTPGSLARLLARSGFAEIEVARDWVPKELSALARKESSAAAQAKDLSPATKRDVRASVEVRLAWLRGVIAGARETFEFGRSGIFGTSIAATWLATELPGRFEFFVDEDPNRRGRTHMGLPVHAPWNVPRGSHVFLALPPSLARSVAGRLNEGAAMYHEPPAFQS